MPTHFQHKTDYHYFIKKIKKTRCLLNKPQKILFFKSIITIFVP